MFWATGVCQSWLRHLGFSGFLNVLDSISSMFFWVFFISCCWVETWVWLLSYLGCLDCWDCFIVLEFIVNFHVFIIKYIYIFFFFPKKYLLLILWVFLLKKQEIKNKKFNSKSKIYKGNINRNNEFIQKKKKKNRNNELKWNET